MVAAFPEKEVNMKVKQEEINRVTGIIETAMKELKSLYGELGETPIQRQEMDRLAGKFFSLYHELPVGLIAEYNDKSCKNCAIGFTVDCEKLNYPDKGYCEYWMPLGREPAGGPGGMEQEV